MKVLHQLYLAFTWYTIIASGFLKQTKLYTLKFNHNIDDIDTIISIKNGPKDNEKTIFVEFKRNNSTFCVWEHEKDPSRNAILITLPHVKAIGFRGRDRTNTETIAFGMPQTNLRQFVFRKDSSWGKYPLARFWMFKMMGSAEANKWLPTCTLQIEFQTTLNLHEKKNFNVELVTALMVNVTTPPTPSPTAHPTTPPTESPSVSPTASPSPLPTTSPSAPPSASPVSNENSDESTIPMPYKILACIFIGLFLLLSLMMYLNKSARSRFCTLCSACRICQKKSQELTQETVTITMHEMKTREN